MTKRNPRIASLPFPEPKAPARGARLQRPLNLDELHLDELIAQRSRHVSTGTSSPVAQGGGGDQALRPEVQRVVRTGHRGGPVSPQDSQRDAQQHARQAFKQVAEAGLTPALRAALAPAESASAGSTSAGTAAGKPAPAGFAKAEVTDRTSAPRSSELLLDICGAGLLMALVLIAAILV